MVSYKWGEKRKSKKIPVTLHSPQLKMPQARTALEHELSDFIDSATKMTKGGTGFSLIFSIFPLLFF